MAMSAVPAAPWRTPNALTDQRWVQEHYPHITSVKQILGSGNGPTQATLSAAIGIDAKTDIGLVLDLILNLSSDETIMTPGKSDETLRAYWAYTGKRVFVALAFGGGGRRDDADVGNDNDDGEELRSAARAFMKWAWPQEPVPNLEAILKAFHKPFRPATMPQMRGLCRKILWEPATNPDADCAAHGRHEESAFWLWEALRLARERYCRSRTRRKTGGAAVGTRIDPVVQKRMDKLQNDVMSLARAQRKILKQQGVLAVRKTDVQALEDVKAEMYDAVAEAIHASEEKTADRISDAIQASEEKITDRISDAIDLSEERTAGKIHASEEKTTDRISDAIDLSEQGTAAKINVSEQRTAEKIKDAIHVSEEKLSDRISDAVHASEDKITDRISDAICLSEERTAERTDEKIENAKAEMYGAVAEAIQASEEQTTVRISDAIHASEGKIADKISDAILASEAKITDRISDGFIAQQHNITELLQRLLPNATPAPQPTYRKPSASKATWHTRPQGPTTPPRSPSPDHLGRK